mgnify:CR=1 FL=1
MSHTKPPANATHQELVLHMVRGHQGCTLIDLKTRMQAEHGSPWKQTENTVARLYRLGLLQNRSTLGHIPCICTPGCKSLPAQVTPNPRSVLAQQATTEKRLKAKAAKAAALAASAPRQQATQPEPNRTTGHLSKGSAGHLCAPRMANARDLVEHIIRLLLTLGDDEHLDAEQVATRLGIPVEVTAVRNALSQMSYHGKVRSRYNAERTRLLYSIDPRTAELLRQKAQQATSQPAAKQATGTAQGEATGGKDDEDEGGIKPGQYNPAALQCDRADAKAFLHCPSLRNGQRVAYAGIQGMCTGAAGPIAHTPPRLKQ